MNVWLKMLNCWKNTLICGIKSVIVLKKNLIANPYTSKKFLNTKIRSDGDEATYFYCRKTPEAGSNYIFWLVIDSALKKGENYFL